MPMKVSRLPKAARQKLQQFEDDRIDAHHRVQKLLEREKIAEANLAEAKAAYDGVLESEGVTRNPTQQAAYRERVTEAEQEWHDATERLKKVSDQRYEAGLRKQEAAQILALCRAWLAKQPGHLTVKNCPSERIRFKKNEMAKDAVICLRKEIAEINQEMHSVRLARMTKAELKQRADDYVEELAEQAKPQLYGVRGDHPLELRFQADQLKKPNNPLALHALFNGEEMVRVMHAMIDDLPKADEISEENRKARIAELEGEKLTLERQEEFLIARALKEGTAVTRRPDADVRAILGVEISEAPKRVNLAAAAE